MTKNIVLLSDGTGNSAAKVWRTNVWRLFQALDLKQSSQIAIYDDGVGTSSFMPLAILGGAFGWGLKRNVLDLYKFVCRNYNAGDKVYGFGFSRGAFTIRVVIGLVLNQGLVNFASESELDKKARAAYRAYRHAKYSAWNLQYPIRLIQFLLDKRFYTPRERIVQNIEFLGLWDTVAAYGLPVDEMTRGVNRWIWPLELPNTEFNPNILKARHALAIDDERATFHPVLWDENQSNTKPAGAQRETKHEQLLQVWFAGMHANVGGGYPDDALANVSLSWILAEARQAGLVFKEFSDAEPDALLSTDSAKDKDGRLYDSRSGLGGYYRYSPRKISDFYDAMRKAAETAGKPAGALVPKIHESGKRTIYFLTVFVTAYLLLYPLFRDSYAFQELRTRLRIVADAIRLVGSALPSFATRWLDAYAREPAWFLVALALVVLLTSIGTSIAGSSRTP